MTAGKIGQRLRVARVRNVHDSHAAYRVLRSHSISWCDTLPVPDGG